MFFQPDWLWKYGDRIGCVAIRYHGETFGFLYLEEIKGRKFIHMSFRLLMDNTVHNYLEPDRYIYVSIVEVFGMEIEPYQSSDWGYTKNPFEWQTSFPKEEREESITLTILAKKLGRALHFNRIRLNSNWLHKARRK